MPGRLTGASGWRRAPRPHNRKGHHEPASRKIDDARSVPTSPNEADVSLAEPSPLGQDVQQSDKSGNLADDNSAISTRRRLDICLIKRSAAPCLSIDFARSGPPAHPSSRVWRVKIEDRNPKAVLDAAVAGGGWNVANHCFQQLLAHTCAHHPSRS